jgi:hypothetical protein
MRRLSISSLVRVISPPPKGPVASIAVTILVAASTVTLPPLPLPPEQVLPVPEQEKSGPGVSSASVVSIVPPLLNLISPLLKVPIE